MPFYTFFVIRRIPMDGCNFKENNRRRILSVWKLADPPERCNDGLSDVLQYVQIVLNQIFIQAAHCVFNKNASDFKIRAGEWDTQNENERLRHSDHEIKEIVIHPKFLKANLNNDIALLFLKDPVQIADHISPVCLPSKDASFENESCYVTGWGRSQFGREGAFEVQLKKINLPVVPFETCQESLRKTKIGHRFKLHTSFICAGGASGQG